MGPAGGGDVSNRVCSCSGRTGSVCLSCKIPRSFTKCGIAHLGVDCSCRSSHRTGAYVHELTIGRSTSISQLASVESGGPGRSGRPSEVSGPGELDELGEPGAASMIASSGKVHSGRPGSFAVPVRRNLIVSGVVVEPGLTVDHKYCSRCPVTLRITTWNWGEPLPHVSLRGTVISKLLAFIHRAMAVAQLTALHLSCRRIYLGAGWRVLQRCLQLRCGSLIIFRSRFCLLLRWR